MPAFSYTVSDFSPFTKIVSADMNTKLNDIKTFFNVTKLDDLNIQDAGITRATKLKLGTSSHVLINDVAGAMSSEAQLSLTRGGTGVSLTLTNPGDVLQINPGATALTFGASPVPQALRTVAFYLYS